MMKSKSTTTHEVEWAICHERQGESFARRLSYTEGLDVVDLDRLEALACDDEEASP